MIVEVVHAAAVDCAIICIYMTTVPFRASRACTLMSCSASLPLSLPVRCEGLWAIHNGRDRKRKQRIVVTPKGSYHRPSVITGGVDVCVDIG